MRAAWLIARKDIWVQIRSGTFVVVGFVAPLVLALVMNLVFGGLDDPDAPINFDVAVVDLDGGPEAETFVEVVDQIADSGLLEVARPDDVAALRRSIDSGDIDAGWMIPAGFSDAVTSGEPIELTVIADVDSPTAASVARSIAGQYATNVGAVRLSTVVAVETGAVSPAGASEFARSVADEPPLVALVPSEASRDRLDIVSNLVGGLALFFVFFTAGLPMVSIIEERSSGSLARLRMAPISAWSIVAGKAMSAVALGTFSLLALMVASTVIMGADWGPPVGAGILVVAVVVAATGIMAVAGATAKTSEQAGNAQTIVAIVLSIAGGAFTPMPISGSGVMARIREITPHGLFLDGLEASASGGLADVRGAVSALVLIGVVTGTVGAMLANRVVSR